MYPCDENPRSLRRSTSFAGDDFGFATFHRTYSLRRNDPPPLPPREHIYDEVFESTIPRYSVKRPLDWRQIKAVDEWDAGSPLNHGPRKIIYPSWSINEEREKANIHRRSSLRVKNFGKAPNLRRVSFDERPIIIDDEMTQNDAQVDNRHALIKALETKLNADSEPQEQKKKKPGKIGQMIRGLLPWHKFQEQKKLKKEKEAKEREECLQFLTPNKIGNKFGSEWQEKNAAVVEELKIVVNSPERKK